VTVHSSEEQSSTAGLTPAKHQLLLALRDHPDSAGTTIAEIADYLLLRHHSAVGLLDRAAAGLIVRERAAQRRGRPRDSWSVAPDALPGAEPPDAYVRLAGWLARSVPARPGRLREVERAGWEIARELLRSGAADSAEEAMGRALTALGFAPQRERRESRQVVFRLGNCPYRQAVKENQPVICELPRGLTRGLVEQLEPSARLARFVPEDPDQAGCVIEVAGLAGQ
jgi:predicted ArsR family transcriptional regulator